MITCYYSESRNLPPKDADYPCLVLQGDNWNDFGFITLFHAFFFNAKGKVIELGDTKILQRDKADTRLPKRFTELSSSFCSLGQSLSFYENVHELGPKRQDEILAALRDVVAAPHLAESWKDEKGFRDSLLRFSEAEKAYREANWILQDTPLTGKSQLSFDYTVKLKAASAPHRLRVEFGTGGILPNRIMVFVGKNGTGKTWMLGRLAADISGDERGEDRFQPQRPSFNRVIAVSYNALDRFRRPPKSERMFSYRYCGIYNEDGTLVPRSILLERIGKGYTALEDKGRSSLWMRVLRDVFDQQFADRCRALCTHDLSEDSLDKLSSGQAILLTVLTEVLAVLETGSLVLYDEPEIHLHPNALAGLMRGLARILNKFDSYAVIATHSPIVLQQVPSAFVRVFRRIGNQPFISRLKVESFGGDITALTEEVFQVNTADTYFREWLTAVSRTATEDQVLSSFDRPLDFNAKALIRSMYSQTAGEED